MKFPKKALFLSLLIAFVSLSCSKESENDSSETGEIFIKHTVSGVEYKYTNPVSAESANVTINGSIANSSTDADYSRISIWFPLGMTTGTFDFTGDVFAEGDYKLKLESNPLNIDGWATSGSVTISSISADYIVGNYTAIVTEDAFTINLTNGEFRAYSME